MKKVIVKLTVHEYMDMYPHYEHRMIEDTEEGRKGIEDFINHMNTHWSGGTISTDYQVLTDAQAKAFLNSKDINPDMVETVRKELGL